MSRQKDLAKNTAILTVGKVCTQCISFFLLPLYTAILSAEDYGTFDLFVTYATLLLPLINWQLDQGLFRFMLDYRGNKDEQKKLFSTLLLSSTAQNIIYVILFICIEPFLKIENAYFLLLYVVLQVYNALFLQFVRGLGYSIKYTIASFISASATTVLNVIALVFLRMGFMVWVELSQYPKKRKLSLHARVVLIFSAVLWVGGAVLIGLMEWNNPATMGGLSVPGKIMASLFQSVSTRTAGMNTIDLEACGPVTKLWMSILQFIGAAPGSTGGGVKVTTIAVVILTIRSVAQGRMTASSMTTTLSPRRFTAL